jgi:hypothetical protein
MLAGVGVPATVASQAEGLELGVLAAAIRHHKPQQQELQIVEAAVAVQEITATARQAAPVLSSSVMPAVNAARAAQ